MCLDSTRDAVGQRPTNLYFSYDSSITEDQNGPIRLEAAAAYLPTLADGDNAPVAVVMHGYSPSSGNIAQYLTVANSLAQKGFVGIVVAMRGRDGSEGTRDSGGLEIYDIFDAVEHIKADPFFASKIDPTNVHISGYSGGGGNVMSALTKFPDYFNLGGAFFGISDYGYDQVDGWYNNGANFGFLRTPTLDSDVGNPNLRDPDLLDRYHARASHLASKNNPYSEIHLFVNNDEPITPKINDIKYQESAVAAESYAGEFDNIHLHVGLSDDSSWNDWNEDGVKDNVEIQNWPHGLSSTIQDRGEAWYIDRLLRGQVPQPTLNANDELFVAGYVRTKPFQLFLGNGQDAAGDLQYSLSDQAMSFELSIASLNKSATGVLTIYENLLSTNLALVELNGQVIDQVELSSGYVYEGLEDGDHIRFLAVSETSTVCLKGCRAAASCCHRSTSNALRYHRKCPPLRWSTQD